jgi:hypothetical protein
VYPPRKKHIIIKFINPIRMFFPQDVFIPNMHNIKKRIGIIKIIAGRKKTRNNIQKNKWI